MIPLLVLSRAFDGISGRVADIVGKKMREISESFQVICISHLPQVAAYADTHFLVHKFDRNKRTESTITQLSPQDSEKEIARLLSGDEISDSSLAKCQKPSEKSPGSREIPARIAKWTRDWKNFLQLCQA